MAKEATPLVVNDLSSFAKNLRKALFSPPSEHPEPPGHVELLNIIARAAGFRNLQALKAAPPTPRPERAALPLTENARRTLMQFDAEGRLLRWPKKFTVQKMALWVLWTRFEAKRIYSEREVDAILKTANAFGDHVTLRRELIDHGLLARKKDGTDYQKRPSRPDDEVRALLSAFRARRTPRPQEPTPID